MAPPRGITWMWVGTARAPGLGSVRRLFFFFLFKGLGFRVQFGIQLESVLKGFSSVLVFLFSLVEVRILMLILALNTITIVTIFHTNTTY